MKHNESFEQYGTSASMQQQQRAYFTFASSASVHETYRDRKRPPQAFYDFYKQRIPEAIECVLLDRNDPWIDCTLALWAENGQTVTSVYDRWFPEGCQWPPAQNSLDFSILHSLISNTRYPLSGCRREEGTLTDEVETDREQVLSESRLVALLADEESAFIEALCLNPGCLEQELQRFAEFDSPYRKITTLVQAMCLNFLSKNQTFTQIAKDTIDGPDWRHHGLHNSFLKALREIPKTDFIAALWVEKTLEEVPPRATYRAWVGEELNKTVESWEVNCVAVEEEIDSRVSRDMTVAESIRFHLRRLYPDKKLLSVDGDDRVNRLAAYATSRIEKERTAAATGSCLIYDEIANYAQRDRQLFRYAACFNKHIYATESKLATTFALQIYQLSRRYVDEKDGSELSWIVGRTISDEEARLKEYAVHLDGASEGQETPIEKRLEKLSEGIQESKKALLEKLAGWEKLFWIAIFVWLATAIWNWLPDLKY